MPFLYILGGANGVGKSTYYETGIEHGFIDPAIPFMNVDLVSKNELGGYSEQNILQAEGLVRERMKVLLEKNESFIIESNLSKKSDYDWIEKMIAKNYDVRLDFLSTGEVEVNKSRVHRRVAEGGHDVPDHIIEQRSAMGITYLKSKIFLFEEAKMIDNAGEEHEEVAVIRYGRIVTMIPDCPQWAKDILHLASRLQQKNRNRPGI